MVSFVKRVEHFELELEENLPKVDIIFIYLFIMEIGLEAGAQTYTITVEQGNKSVRNT
jgi:hypothetical protein